MSTYDDALDALYRVFSCYPFRPLIESIKAFLSDPNTAEAMERAFEVTNDGEEQNYLYVAVCYLRL